MAMAMVTHIATATAIQPLHYKALWGRRLKSEPIVSVAKTPAAMRAESERSSATQLRRQAVQSAPVAMSSVNLPRKRTGECRPLSRSRTLRNRLRGSSATTQRCDKSCVIGTSRWISIWTAGILRRFHYLSSRMNPSQRRDFSLCQSLVELDPTCETFRGAYGRHHPPSNTSLLRPLTSQSQSCLHAL